MNFRGDEEVPKDSQNSGDGPGPSENDKGEMDNINLIDRQLEYHDPTPNIHDLFVSFDNRFFWGKLGMVKVKWSNKMTTCAGMCSYQGKKGLCTIKLSAPLLILRPRKDLVETLLHEMIHAYLFVTQNFKEREDHGPDFLQHMNRINNEAGTSINIFHNFHYEVAFYQTHIWRCNGPCRNKHPFFGFVKRATNRAPGPSDSWWQTHQVSCGGSFIKVSQPEKGKNEQCSFGNKDIRDFLKPDNPKPSTSSRCNQENRPSTSNATVVRDEDMGEHSKSNKEVVRDGGNAAGAQVVKAETEPGPSHRNKNEERDAHEKRETVDAVQNISTHKYPSDNETGGKKRSYSKTPIEGPTEKKKKQITCPVCSQPFCETVINEHVDDCLKDESSVEIVYEKTPSKNSDDNLEEVFNLHHARCPVCGEGLEPNELNDHLEVCFSFTFENEDTAADDKADAGKVSCPCCFKWVKEKNINVHMDECLTFFALKNNVPSN